MGVNVNIIDCVGYLKLGRPVFVYFGAKPQDVLTDDDVWLLGQD